MAGYDSEQFSLDLLQVDERLRQVIQAVYIDYYYSDDDEDGNNDGSFINIKGDVDLDAEEKVLNRLLANKRKQKQNHDYNKNDTAGESIAQNFILKKIFHLIMS